MQIGGHALRSLAQLPVGRGTPQKHQRGFVRVAPRIDSKVFPDTGHGNGDGMWQPIGPKLVVSGHESGNQKSVYIVRVD
ncbi:hypothetical protein APV28_3394 [Comamonas testosteroni]|nr:hypothetical protein APV28_3394 [Comamonas testosteroni]